MNLLVLSNGYGEDKVGLKFIEIIEGFKAEFNFWAMPVVGNGQAYRKNKRVTILGPNKTFPSGGFLRNPKDWLTDLKSGLIRHHLMQIKNLKKLSSEEKIDIVVAIGDFFLLLLNRLATLKVLPLRGRGLKKKVYFLPTAKSNYFQKHFWIEKILMKRWCIKVFPRDELTAEDLRQAGINAEYFGNVLMDIIDDEGDEDIIIESDKKIIAILPGSRDEAYRNLEKVRMVIDSFEKVACDKNLEVSIYMALPPSLDENKVAKIVKNCKIRLIKGKFKTIVEKADLVLGLAGTANEQAFGLGKPVIAFEGYGPQTTIKRFSEQKKLLGSALIITHGGHGEIANRMLSVLLDEKLLSEIREKAELYMGKPGGVIKIAKEIVYGTL